MRPTLFLTVGLPGTGKTTAAQRIEVERQALRLTKDEWVKALYGLANPPSASDVIEGRLIDVGLRALELGVDVIVDFGLWGRDERSALRQAAAELGAAVEMRYFELTPTEQRRRLDQRQAEAPNTTWRMSDEELGRVSDVVLGSGDHVGMGPRGVLTDEQWAVLERYLPPEKGAMGRPATPHRPVVEGIVYRYRTGIAWRDLPGEFGPWQTVWKRHHKWSADGTWDQVMGQVLADADAAGLVDWKVSADSTVVRAHQHGTNVRRASGPSSYTGGAGE